MAPEPEPAMPAANPATPAPSTVRPSTVRRIDVVVLSIAVSRSAAMGRTRLARRAGPTEESIVTAMPTTKAVVTVADVNGELLRAAAAGDADGAARALAAGADIEARDGQQRTPLLLAAAADHVEVARLLVSHGADPDALDAQHDTPWLVTGVTGSVPMLEAILPAHPDLTIVNRFGGVSVIPAAERGHVDYVRRVVTTGIDVNHVNRLGWTALLEAVLLGEGGEAHQEIVRILLAAGADASIADSDGVTALEHARAKGYDEIAALLEVG